MIAAKTNNNSSSRRIWMDDGVFALFRAFWIVSRVDRIWVWILSCTRHSLALISMFSRLYSFWPIKRCPNIWTDFDLRRPPSIAQILVFIVLFLFNFINANSYTRNGCVLLLRMKQDLIVLVPFVWWAFNFRNSYTCDSFKFCANQGE